MRVLKALVLIKAGYAPLGRVACRLQQEMLEVFMNGFNNIEVGGRLRNRANDFHRRAHL